jgi:hypothetical protein
VTTTGRGSAVVDEGRHLHDWHHLLFLGSDVADEIEEYAGTAEEVHHRGNSVVVVGNFVDVEAGLKNQDV